MLLIYKYIKKSENLIKNYLVKAINFEKKCKHNHKVKIGKNIYFAGKRSLCSDFDQQKITQFFPKID